MIDKKAATKYFIGYYLIAFVAIFFSVIILLMFSHSANVSLSPPDVGDSGRVLADSGEVKGEEIEQFQSEGGLAGGGVITECDYMVEPQEGEEWFEPYPVYHMFGPGDYIIGNDLIMDDSTLSQYSSYIKGCLTLLESGDYTVDGQGHTVTIDDITCQGVCPGLYSAGAAFYLKGGKEINFEINNIHTSNKLNSLVKAEPGYFDEFFNFYVYGLSGHTITILNSQIESEKTIDMPFMNANAYIDNSEITSNYMDYCSLEGNCESNPVNPSSTIELHDVDINSFYAYETSYVALAEISASGSGYGSYDLTVESLNQDLDLQQLVRADVSNAGFSEDHLGHLSLICRDQCDSLVDSQNSNYHIPISFSLLMNEGEIWFGKEPSSVPAGSAGDELRHPSASYLYFSNLQNKLTISHNFISIIDDLGEGDIFDRPAVLILHNNPSGGASNLKILRNGVECTSCVAFTPLNAASVIFSVPSAGNYSIGGQAPMSYDISQSVALSNGIVWSNALPSTINVPANGNNGAGATSYFLSISAQGTNVDVYMKANSDLIINGGGSSIPLANEKYSFSSNPNVPGGTSSLGLSYSTNKIGNNLANGSIIYLKFFLDTPGGQQAGDYSNLVSFIAVPAGSSPPA